MNTNFVGAYLSIQTDYEIPANLRNFLSLDDQGMKGLEVMLNNPKLAKRIPANVRLEYEALYASISAEIDEQISRIRNHLDELENNPKSAIHEIIAHSYASNK